MVEDQGEVGVLRSWVKHERDERIDRRLLGDEVEGPSLRLALIGQGLKAESRQERSASLSMCPERRRLANAPPSTTRLITHLLVLELNQGVVVPDNLVAKVLRLGE